jgi:hypothetical protein
LVLVRAGGVLGVLGCGEGVGMGVRIFSELDWR